MGAQGKDAAARSAPGGKRSLKMTERFYARRQDLWDCFTDTQRLQAFTRGPAVVCLASAAYISTQSPCSWSVCMQSSAWGQMGVCGMRGSDLGSWLQGCGLRVTGLNARAVHAALPAHLHGPVQRSQGPALFTLPLLAGAFYLPGGPAMESALSSLLGAGIAANDQSWRWGRRCHNVHTAPIRHTCSHCAQHHSSHGAQ